MGTRRGRAKPRGCAATALDGRGGARGSARGLLAIGVSWPLRSERSEVPLDEHDERHARERRFRGDPHAFHQAGCVTEPLLVSGRQTRKGGNGRLAPHRERVAIAPSVLRCDPGCAIVSAKPHGFQRPLRIGLVGPDIRPRSAN